MSDSKSTALGIIRAEHRSLGAVINSMKALIEEVRMGKAAMNYPLLWSMVHYIDAFPDQLHHPKEDRWLFEHLKRRTQEADELIAALVRDHDDEEAALNNLRKSLGNCEAGVAGSLEALLQTLHGYAEFTWRHMRREENELIPLAERHLTTSDWNEIALAFGDNGDPLVGQKEGERFFEMFRKIVEQTPAPIGLGSKPRP